jgi:glycosyltransferase involved in cell wall biosynthesis
VRGSYETMKILHLIYDHIHNPWVAGGGAVRVHELYRRLAGRHDIEVVCGAYPGAENYTKDNVQYRFEGTRRNNYILSTLCYSALAARYIKNRADAYDIVVEDFAPYNPVFSFIRKKDAVIQVHHREGLNLIKRYFFFGALFALVEKYYPKLFRNVICVSEASRNKFGLIEASVIPNGIDEVSEAISPEHDYISFVGRLHIHNKGLDTLIGAMALVDARLGIAGKGRDEKKLTARIRDNKLEKRVEFKGFLTNVGKTEFISSSMFLVLPSRYEGQGIVVLDAAACGKPVIVSDIPELQYAVDAGFGLSFRTGDAGDLAKKINFLIKDPHIRQEMGNKAREYARNFTWDRIAEEYERFLLGILREGKREL